MALARTRRSEVGMNYWPGFVDALSTLILSIIFILTVFVVVQFFLQQEISGKDTALTRLNAQIAQLTDLLSMEKSCKSDVEEQLAQLRASLATTESERDKYKGIAEGAGTGISDGAKQGRRRSPPSSKARSRFRRTRWRRSKSSTSRSPPSAASSPRSKPRSTPPKSKDKESQSQIANLGQRLNIALAQKVEELKTYRSNFFGELRKILGNRPDVRIVGDRFVLQSELFFDTGKADLKPAATAELDKIAAALIGLEQQIPANIPWVLRVDGHTDVRPITGGAFKSNWDLSAARAIAVVQYLVSKGVSPQRLVAAGFGEYQPIDLGTTDEAYRKNRRIEFKLTER